MTVSQTLEVTRKYFLNQDTNTAKLYGFLLLVNKTFGKPASPWNSWNSSEVLRSSSRVLGNRMNRCIISGVDKASITSAIALDTVGCDALEISALKNTNLLFDIENAFLCKYFNNVFLQ